jgi:hypothetical protein
LIQPTPHRLRPLSLGDILDTAIALYRQNFALFAGVVAVIAVPEALITLLIRLSQPASPFSTTTTRGFEGGSSTSFQWHTSYFAGFGGSLLVTAVFNVLITGALARTISERYLGRQITIAESYTEVGVGGFVSLAIASILTGILTAAGFVVAGVIIALLVLIAVAGVPAWISVLLGIVIGVAGVAAAVYVWVHLQFVAQAIVIERRGIIASLKRSWDLINGSGWRVFGIVIVISLLVFIVSAIVGGVLNIPLAILNAQAGSVVGSLLSILFQPFQFAAYTLLYYDLRVRKEGFDMEQLAGHIGESRPVP